MRKGVPSCVPSSYDLYKAVPTFGLPNYRRSALMKRTWSWFSRECDPRSFRRISQELSFYLSISSSLCDLSLGRRLHSFSNMGPSTIHGFCTRGILNQMMYFCLSMFAFLAMNYGVISRVKTNTKMTRKAYDLAKMWSYHLKFCALFLACNKFTNCCRDV
jgi:hypothetical protein